jgi:hypothetical protein
MRTVFKNKDLMAVIEDGTESQTEKALKAFSGVEFIEGKSITLTVYAAKDKALCFYRPEDSLFIRNIKSRGWHADSRNSSIFFSCGDTILGFNEKTFKRIQVPEKVMSRMISPIKSVDDFIEWAKERDLYVTTLNGSTYVINVNKICTIGCNEAYDILKKARCIDKNDKLIVTSEKLQDTAIRSRGYNVVLEKMQEIYHTLS